MLTHKVSAGEHPNVCLLLGGINSWKTTSATVLIVLGCRCGFKETALRVCAIKDLSVKSMAKSSDQHIFHFHKLNRSCRKTHSPQATTCHVFPYNTTLCVARALDEYIKKNRRL